MNASGRQFSRGLPLAALLLCATAAAQEEQQTHQAHHEDAAKVELRLPEHFALAIRQRQAEQELQLLRTEQQILRARADKLRLENQLLEEEDRRSYLESGSPPPDLGAAGPAPAAPQVYVPPVPPLESVRLLVWRPDNRVAIVALEGSGQRQQVTRRGDLQGITILVEEDRVLAVAGNQERVLRSRN